MCYCLFLLPSLASALDTGGAIFQYRWYSLYEENSENGKFAGKSFAYDTQASLEVWQNLYGYGQLRGLAEWLDTDGNNRLDRAFIELGDYPLWRDVLLTARLGDKEILYSPLIEPFVRFRGGTLTLDAPRWALTFFGGQARRSIGLTGLTSPYVNQYLAGMRGKYIWGPLTLGLGALWVEGSQKEFGPRQKTTTTLTWDGEWRIQPWLKLVGEADLSFYDLQNDNKGYRRDYALMLGPVVKSAPLTLEILYKRIGPFTSSVSENFGNDKEGIFILWDYRPYKFLGIFGGFQGYREDLNHLKELLASQNVLGRAGVRLLGGGVWPSLIASYDFAQRRSTEKTDNPVYTELSNYNLEINQYLAGFRYSLRYQRVEFKDLVDDLRNYRTEGFYADFRKLWSRYWETYFSGQFIRFFDRTDFITQRYYNGRLGVMYRIFGVADLRAEAAYARIYKYRHDGTDSTEDRGEAVGALVVYLPWQMNFNLEYTFRRILGHTGRKSLTEDVRSTSQSQVSFRLTKRFAWGEPVVTRGAAVPGLAPGRMALPWGTINGYVFVDVNGNKIMDPGEAGLGGMKITLEDGTMATTDSQGYFEISRVVIGEHTVSFDLRRLPVNYDPISLTKQKVEVKQHEKSRVDFAVGSLGTIMGRVIADANANGRVDEGEEGLAGIGIILERDEGKKTAYSDASGDFLFDNILGGTYKIYVDPSTLPAESKLTSPESLTVNLPPGGEIKDLRFLIYIKSRPVIKTFIGNGAPQPKAPPAKR